VPPNREGKKGPEWWEFSNFVAKKFRGNSEQSLAAETGDYSDTNWVF
jgi:hypothetical protein